MTEGETVSDRFVDFNRVLRWGYANLFVIGKRADTIRPYDRNDRLLEKLKFESL